MGMMKDIDDERTTLDKPFSYLKMMFRYKYAKRYMQKGSILDIGCGYAYAAKLFTEFQYIGIDYYEPAIEYCTEFYSFGSFRVMKLPKLDFPDYSLDNIICCEVIEHITVEEGNILLSEAYRVLKGGGVLFLSTPNRDNKVEMSKNHLVEYDAKEMKSMLILAGFDVIHKGGLVNTLMVDFIKKIRGPQGAESESLAIPTPLTLRTKNPIIKHFLKLIALSMIYSGYFYPKKAYHQVYVCKKN